MQNQKSSGQKASHAVTEENIGDIRKLFPDLFPQLFHVLDNEGPAVVFGKNALFIQPGNGLAVTEMVVADGNIGVFRKKAHEILVAVNMFGDSVGNLDNAFGRTIGDAHSGADFILAR